MNNYDDLLNNEPAEGQAAQFSKEDYAAKKKAERDEVFALSDSAALDVAGDGSKFRQYLDAQSRFDRYSAVNTLLIMAQKPEATRLGDFEHWKERGGFVKPGQTGISILEPHEYTRDDGTPGIGYNVKKVFDISQVDARKIKTTPPPNYDSRLLLRALITKAPVKITGVTELQNGGGAKTDPRTGEIFVLKGMEFGDTFRCLAHELAYAEAGRDKVTDPGFTAYCVSYALCKKYGVDTKGYNFDGAVSVLGDMEPQEVKGELSQIRDIADVINGRMAKQIDAFNKAARDQEAR